MSTKAVLFDLDGTLLPMDFDVYLKDYFVRMATKMAANGYDDKLLMKGIYAGMHAMINNDGSCTNQEALWKEMVNVFGEKVYCVTAWIGLISICGGNWYFIKYFNLK